MNHSEEYIIANADSFYWNYFKCEQSVYSEEFMDRCKEKIRCYTLNGKLHSYKDRPALIYKDKYHHSLLDINHINLLYFQDDMNMWFKNGRLHREGDNAVKYPDIDSSVYNFLNGEMLKPIINISYKDVLVNYFHKLWNKLKGK